MPITKQLDAFLAGRDAPIRNNQGNRNHELLCSQNKSFSELIFKVKGNIKVMRAAPWCFQRDSVSVT